jgi:acetylglutamate kinase
VVIIDGRKNHSILFELLSDKGSGTLIRQWKI